MERLLTRDQSETSDLIERCIKSAPDGEEDAALQKQVSILH